VAKRYFVKERALSLSKGASYGMPFGRLRARCIRKKNFIHLLIMNNEIKRIAK
jgi:hypothetical protein